MPDIATLGLAVDTRQVKDLNRQLDLAARAGIRTQRSADRLTRETRQLGGAMGRASGQVRQMHAATQGLGTASAGLSGAFRTLGVAMGGLFAITAVTRAFSASIEVHQAFTKSLSELSAITGATGKDLEFYAAQSAEIGKTTTLSASQAVTAFKLIASAKPDLLESRDALAAVTKEAVTLAEASGLDLPTAARALGSALNQFGAGAEEASRFINVLAAGSKFGASEINLTAIALKNAGTVAAAANISFEETNAAIQALANVAIFGGEAGTQLRNIILRLQKEGVEELDPSVVGLTTALENLRDENRSTVELMKIFGQESLAAGQALLNQIDTLRKLDRQLTGTQTAYEQQRIITDNLDADLKGLASVVESIVIQAFKDLDGELRSIVQLMSDVARGINEFQISLSTTHIEPVVSFTEQLENVNEQLQELSESRQLQQGNFAETFREVYASVFNAIPELPGDRLEKDLLAERDRLQAIVDLDPVAIQTAVDVEVGKLETYSRELDDVLKRAEDVAQSTTSPGSPSLVESLLAGLTPQSVDLARQRVRQQTEIVNQLFALQQVSEGLSVPDNDAEARALGNSLLGPLIRATKKDGEELERVVRLSVENAAQIPQLEVPSETFVGPSDRELREQEKALRLKQLQYDADRLQTVEAYQALGDELLRIEDERYRREKIGLRGNQEALKLAEEQHMFERTNIANQTADNIIKANQKIARDIEQREREQEGRDRKAADQERALASREINVARTALESLPQTEQVLEQRRAFELRQLDRTYQERVKRATDGERELTLLAEEAGQARDAINQRFDQLQADREQQATRRALEQAREQREVLREEHEVATQLGHEQLRGLSLRPRTQANLDEEEAVALQNEQDRFERLKTLLNGQNGRLQVALQAHENAMEEIRQQYADRRERLREIELAKESASLEERNRIQREADAQRARDAARQEELLRRQSALRIDRLSRTATTVPSVERLQRAQIDEIERQARIDIDRAESVLEATVIAAEADEAIRRVNEATQEAIARILDAQAQAQRERRERPIRQELVGLQVDEIELESAQRVAETDEQRARLGQQILENRLAQVQAQQRLLDGTERDLENRAALVSTDAERTALLQDQNRLSLERARLDGQELALQQQLADAVLAEKVAYLREQADLARVHVAELRLQEAGETAILGAKLSVLEAERDIILAKEDSAQKDLALLQNAEQMKAVRRQISESEGEGEGGFFGGLLQGFEDFARANESAFGLAQETARNAARSMQQGFQQTFFDVMEGRIRSFADGFRALERVALNVASNIIASFASFGVQQLLFGQGGLLQGLAGAVGGGLLGPNGGGVGVQASAGSRAFTETFPHGNPYTFATGGIVPGVGNRDSVPILATPGEGILTRRGVQALSRLNAGMGGSGGEIEVNVYNYSGEKTDVKPTQTPQGQRIDILVGEIISNQVNNDTGAGRTIRQRYGLSLAKN